MDLLLLGKVFNQINMSGFNEQLAKLKLGGDFNNVYPNTSWTLQDYKDMMESIDKMEIIQNFDDYYNAPTQAFVLNAHYTPIEEDISLKDWRSGM